MGIFDDLLAPYEAPEPRQRLGLFDDLLAPYEPDDEPAFQSWYAERARRLDLDADPDAPEHHYDYRAAFRAGAEPDATGHWPSLYKADDHPNRFIEEGIWILDTKTGARRPKPIPGALSNEELEQQFPDLPREGADFDPRAFGRVAGVEAISTAPQLAGLVDAAAGWLERPSDATAPPSVLEGVRRGLALSPMGLGMRAGKAVRDALGVTGGIETANEALEALQSEDRETLRRAADTPEGSVAAEFGARGLGALADPTNLIGGRALVKGGRAIAGAIPETWSPLKRYLLQDLFPAAVDSVRSEREALLAPLHSAADEALVSGGASADVHAGALVGFDEGEVARAARRGSGGEGLEQPSDGLRSALLEQPDDAPEIVGRESIAYLSDGKPVRTRWVLRDADSIETSHEDNFALNPRYPHETGAQPRDLSRPAEQLKIQQIRDDYNPDLIGPSNFLSDGAGTFARRPSGRPYLLVGNSRTMAQRRALEDPLVLAKQADALGRQNREFGFPEDFLEQANAAGIRKPAVFREVLGEFDPAHLGREGNVATIGSLSDVDVAAADARRLTPELLDLVADGAPIDAAANRDFVRAYFGTVVPERELGPLVGPNGELAASGERRIRNALLSAAYRDADAVSRLVEADAEGIRAVGRGMAASAPRLAKLAARASRGEVFARDIGPDVAQAARKLAELRAKRMPVEMYLNQTGLFGHELTPEARQLLGAWNELRRDQSAPAGILRRYADLVDSFGDPRQASLLGPAEAPEKAQILEEAIRTWKASEQPLLFAGGQSALVASIADALPGPWGQILARVKPGEALGKANVFLNRLFSSSGKFADTGDLADPILNALRRAAAERRYHATRMEMNIHDAGVATKRFQSALAESGISRTEEEIGREMLAFVEGKSDGLSLSSGLREVAGRMRDHFDELTGNILENPNLPKDLRYTLDQNRGRYVTRTFELHRDPEEWMRFMKEHEPWRWQNFRAWLAEQNPQWTDDRIQAEMETYFSKEPEAAMALAPRMEEARVDKGIFKRRIRQHYVNIEGEPSRAYATKEAAERAAAAPRTAGKKVTVTEEEGLPRAMEQFLGLHEDVRPRYAEGVARMAQDAATMNAFREIRALGENRIFFRAPQPGAVHSIGGDPSFNALAGMFASEKVATVFNSMQASQAAATWVSKVVNGAVTSNAYAKLGKAVINPQGQVRNIVSWIPTGVANGKFTAAVRIPRLFKAAKTLAGGKLAPSERMLRLIDRLAGDIETASGSKLNEVFSFEHKALQSEWLDFVRRGHAGEGPRSQEIAHFLGLVSKPKPLPGTNAGHARVREFAEKAISAPGKFLSATFTGGDEFGKFLMWKAEQADYQHAFPELSEDQVKDLVDPLMSDLYPTASKAMPVVKFLRDLPLGPNFPTYYGEIVRTYPNIAIQGAKELASGNPRLAVVGARRLAGLGVASLWKGGVIGASGGVALAGYNYLSGRLGVSRDELEAGKEFARDWEKYDDLMPIARLGDGRLMVVDTSYVNPYAQFRAAWNAAAATGFDYEGTKAAMDQFFEPFTSENFLHSTYMDIKRNKTEDGRQVFPEFGTDQEQLAAVASHAERRLEPGIAGQYRNLVSGVTGEENPKSGRKVELLPFLYGFATGTRIFTIDATKAIPHFAYQLKAARSEIVGRYNQARLAEGMGPGDLLNLKAAGNANFNRALAEMGRKVDAARRMHLSDYQIRKLLADAELGAPTIDALMGGYAFEVLR